MKIKTICLVLLLILWTTGCSPRPPEPTADASSSAPIEEASSEESQTSEPTPYDLVPVDAIKGTWYSPTPEFDEYPLTIFLSSEALYLMMGKHTFQIEWTLANDKYLVGVLTEEEAPHTGESLTITLNKGIPVSLTVNTVQYDQPLTFLKGEDHWLTNDTFEDFFTYIFKEEAVYSQDGTFNGVNVASFYELKPEYASRLLTLHITYQLYYLDQEVKVQYDTSSNSFSYEILSNEEESSVSEEEATEEPTDEVTEEEESSSQEDPEYFNGVTLLNSRNGLINEDHWGKTLRITDGSFENGVLEGILTMSLPAEIVHVTGFIVLTP